MNRNTGPIEIYTSVANSLGLETEMIQSSPTRKRLLISNEETFCLVSPGTPGFFPAATRWAAHFTSSKQLTQEMLKRYGYNVIKTQEIHSSSFPSQRAMIQNLQEQTQIFPVLTKPDRGQDGIGIEIVENKKQLATVAKRHYKEKADFLIQPIINENEYRILVINDEVMLMHSKEKQEIVGDGSSTIQQLLATIPITKKDPVFIQWQHVKQKTNMGTVLKKGHAFPYHLTNIPSATYYKTEDFDPAVVAWARKIAKTLSTSVVGIDVFIPGDIADTNSFTIIELNSNPALYYLPKRCNDTVTAFRITEKVLRDYFKIE